MLLTGLAYTGNRQTFTDILKPGAIQVHDDEIFIIEGAAIYIYSLEDFRLKKKFGKEGEGPREFKLSALGLAGHLICLTVLPDALVVSSENRISYFSREAEFLRESKMPEFKTYKDSIFVAGTEEFVIDVYDANGKKLREIKRQYQKREINRQARDEIIKTWKQDFPFIRREWEVFKKMIKIQEAFPAFRTFYIVDDKIYVQTCKVENNKTEFFIFSIDGTLIKQTQIPLAYRDMLNHFPYTIAKDKLYQLVENEETENWELVVTQVN